MKTPKSLHIIFPALFAIQLLAGCSSGLSDETTASGEYTLLVLSVNLGSADGGQMRHTRSEGFGNFNNEDDKWGVPGENMEELRILILDGGNNVEVNRPVTMSNVTQTEQYTFKVRKNDRKTVVLLANEGDYVLDGEGTEDGVPIRLRDYMNGIDRNDMILPADLEKLIVTLDANSSGSEAGSHKSLKAPLLISAVYKDETVGEEKVTERSYDIHRAAVKYSFRVINQSLFPHTLEGIRIKRIADKEFLFPHATYTRNALGHTVIDAYSTPSTVNETEYAVTDMHVVLPAAMTDGVQVLEPIYLPEGTSGNTAAQQVSITLDGAPLDIWRDLKWLMPGETEAVARPMVDLPRNSHVVVNVTITDHDIDFTADVQPYAEVRLTPDFGLGRDEDGNVIVTYYPDGSYDVYIDEKLVHKDKDGDIELKKFEDGTLLYRSEVFRDYINEDNTNTDEKSYLEKDNTGGNMVILRQQSNCADCGTGNNEQEEEAALTRPDHVHGKTDKPLFVMDKKGTFYKVTYDSEDKASLSTTDTDGARIVQANGFQFRGSESMKEYCGTYVVVTGKDADGFEIEELRHFQTGVALDWGDPTSPLSAGSSRKTVNTKAILQMMRRANALPLRLLNRHSKK